MYPVLGALGIPVAWQQALSAGRLDGKRLLTGTTRNEMTSFFAFDPRVQAITADQARSIVAGLVAGGAERFDRAAARLRNAAPRDVLTDVETEIMFRDGTLAVADHQAARRPRHLRLPVRLRPGRRPGAPRRHALRRTPLLLRHHRRLP